MIECPKCGCNNKDGSNFCERCQQRFEYPNGHGKAAPAAHPGKEINYQNSPLGQDASVSIGDKNVFAADVIAKQIKVEDGGTCINIENEANKLVQCHFCHENITAAGSIQCHRCHKLTCEKCFDRESNLCKACRETEYREAFSKARKNRVGWGKFLSPENSEELKSLRTRYKIEPSRAAVLQNEVIGNEHEPESLGDSDFRIFDVGKMEEAYQVLCDSLNCFPYTTAFNSRLLYVILNMPSPDSGNRFVTRASEIIDMAFKEGNDSLDIYLVLIDHVLDGQGFPSGIRNKLKSVFNWMKAPDDLAFAEFLLDRAQTIWHENIHLKCRYVYYLQKLYAAHGYPQDRQLAQKELSALNEHLPEAPSKMFRSWLAKVRSFDDSDFDPTPEYCDKHDFYYFILNPLSSEAYHKKARQKKAQGRKEDYFKLLTIAATKYPDSSSAVLTELADCYITGFGTAQNVQQGLEYYRKAAAVLGTKIEFNGTVFTSYHGYGRHAEYTVPPGITEIASGAFSDDALTTVTIPSTVDTICAEAFSNCGALETVVLSEGLRTIEQKAFTRCERLREITIPKTVTRLEAVFPPGCVVMFAGDVPAKGSKYLFDGFVFYLPDLAGVKAIAYRFRTMIRSANDSASWCHEAITGQCGHDCQSCLLCSNSGFAELKILAFDAFCKENGISLPVAPSPLSVVDIILAVAEKYRSGIDGMPRDDAKAAKWYSIAAKRKNADAQFKLAGLYSRGIGIGKNDAEAVKWYRAAAEQGNAEAQFILAERYAKGVGVGKNEAEAVQWYRKAAEQGNAGAQFILAGHYFNGIGVKKNEAEAVRWCRKAAEQGIAEAQFRLAKCYYASRGTSKDNTEAAKWSRRAAGQNIADALSFFILGDSCFFGWEGKRDYAEAVRWYKLAVAAQDNGEDSLSLSDRKQIAGHLLSIVFMPSSAKNLIDASLVILTKLSCWEYFTGDIWTKLLSIRPDCAKYCGLATDSTVTHWTKLTVDDWKVLANKDPRFKTIYDLRRGINVVQHLSGHPEMAKYCIWAKVPSAEWVRLLKDGTLTGLVREKNPSFLSSVPWHQMKRDEWVELLSARPEYAPHCKWQSLKDEDYKKLLKVADRLWASFDNNNRPPLLVIEKMNWGKHMNWDKVTAKQWLDFMVKYPGLADFCKWDSFSADDWVTLLSKQPQFAPKCRWNLFLTRHWNDLILKRPEMQKCFSYDIRHFYVWEHIWNYTEYSGEIRKRLSNRFAFLASFVFLLFFTVISLFGNTGWFSLFDESWSHALISGAGWLILCLACAMGYSYFWGPFFSQGKTWAIWNRWLNLVYAGFASFSLYTFFHWSFFFSRWSLELTVLAVLSFLCFSFVILDSQNTGIRWIPARPGHEERCHIWAMTVIPYFVTFCWFVLSPIECSAWLISAIVLLFILLSGVVWYEIRKKADKASLKIPVFLICLLVPPVIIGIWFLMSPVSPTACYRIGNSLRHSFKHASQAFYQKGQSADSDYKQLSDILNPEPASDAWQTSE